MRAEQHAQRGQRFLQARQWQQALAEWRAALAVNPDQPEWRFDLGLTLEALGRFNEAADSFRLVLIHRPHDVQATLRLGINLVRCRQYTQAVEHLTAVTNQERDSEPAYCHLILAQAMLGRHELAEQAFYAARLVTEECPLCFEHVAVSLWARKDWARALWCWQQVLRLEPDHPLAHRKLAQLQTFLGRPSAARDHLFMHLIRCPSDGPALIELGHLLLELDRPTEAMTIFQRALGIASCQARAHLGLAQAALVLGRHDTARAHLGAVQTKRASPPGLLGLRARLAFACGHRAQAYRLGLCQARQEGMLPRQRLDLARLMIDLRRPERASELVTPLIEWAWADRGLLRAALLYRSVALLQSRRTDRGIADCRQLLRMGEHEVISLENLTLGYLRAGRLGRAAACLRRCERMRPSDPRLRQLRWRLAAGRTRRMIARRLGWT
ncbi:MAG: tetratricopeptide repeat protein [Phycisphaeraceae bacterium]|nr:tetratricopeptide repeat protein [Phycisphaeraceae bacterium]